MIMLVRAVDFFFRVIDLLIIVRCAGSFFVRPGDQMYRLYLGICSLTDPILAPCRMLLNRIGFGRGMVDFSPVLAIILLSVIQAVLGGLLRLFYF